MTHDASKCHLWWDSEKHPLSFAEKGIIKVGVIMGQLIVLWWRISKLASTRVDVKVSVAMIVRRPGQFLKQLFHLPVGKITVYGIPEILFWKIRNALLIYHTWYKRDFRKNTEISAMRSVPKPHQPPHLLSFGISMFVYRKENNTVQMKVYQNFTNHPSLLDSMLGNHILTLERLMTKYISLGRT